MCSMGENTQIIFHMIPLQTAFHNQNTDQMCMKLDNFEFILQSGSRLPSESICNENHLHDIVYQGTNCDQKLKKNKF